MLPRHAARVVLALVLAVVPACRARHQLDAPSGTLAPSLLVPSPVAPLAPVGSVPAMKPPTAAGDGMPRALFLASWTTGFVRHVCASDQYFRQCFRDVDDAACDRLMTSAANNCIVQNMATIPDPLPRGQGSTVGRTLGTCAGTAFESTLSMEGRRISNAVCNDVNHWVH